MPGDPQVRFGGRGHRNQSMLPTPILRSPTSHEAAQSINIAQQAFGAVDGSADVASAPSEVRPQPSEAPALAKRSDEGSSCHALVNPDSTRNTIYLILYAIL
jgi:hypothetical protein